MPHGSPQNGSDSPPGKELWLAKLSFLADMNISPLTVKSLRELGWESWRVSELMDKRTSDLDILMYARKHRHVVITHDLDFSTLLAFGGYRKPSVISLRLEEARPEIVTEKILHVISQLEEELAEGTIVSVDETSFRYRTLPLK
jgi:predicted nuclease of predicted toxin-antitoxin system